MQRRIVGSLVVAGAAASGYYAFRRNAAHRELADYRLEQEYVQNRRNFQEKENIRPIPCEDGTLVIPWTAPPRKSQLERLRSDRFDVLVIGGGCVGAGVALDASSRGLNVALVESNDFGAGTSSRSTKLIHGGVRYLQSAILNLDLQAWHLVKEALEERSFMMYSAPYMSKPLPIMVPCYKFYEIPMYWFGMKLYDLIAGGDMKMPGSHFISAREAVFRFPSIRTKGLKGAIVYYDGIHNDSRTNLHIALTAAQNGGTVLNHVEVRSLLKDAAGKLSGAVVRDKLTGEEFKVRSKSIVNATGPFADNIRLMDNPEAQKLIVPAHGVHVVLPDHFSPDDMGLIIPKTDDGRVLFFLPWEGSTLAGTTDAEGAVTEWPVALSKDVGFILNESNKFVKRKITDQDVRAAWAGVRPLVRDPTQPNTAALSRNHVIDVSQSGLVSIMGGKWTTYRRMAEDTIDELLRMHADISGGPCRTSHIQLVGADRARQVCAQSFDKITVTLREKWNMDRDLATHLTHNYGTRALQVVGQVPESDKPSYSRLCSKYLFIDLEVLFAVQHEYACTLEDVLARRLRLAFLDPAAAAEIAPKVAAIMQKELKWSKSRTAAEMKSALAFLKTMQANAGPE